MTENLDPRCSICGVAVNARACYAEEGKGPDNCPTKMLQELAEEANQEYADAKVREFARLASVQEAECYQERDRKPYLLHASKPRIQEICEFADKISAKKLGLAFCVGLALEARLVDNIFTRQGFQVVSVVCKVGRMLKEDLGIKDEEKIFIGTDESACNPILQAKVLNHAGTDLNVLLGLCVGHDSLFLKYAEAFNTVLAVKDRVTGHNPLAAIYTQNSYYMFTQRPGF
ncbi:MAG: DUF1847 domain-containing protein [Deltaproteobacteria bacterium]|nr:DUF1847 domain-containing protein [Deltaproteobacteria bacterium]